MNKQMKKYIVSAASMAIATSIVVGESTGINGLSNIAFFILWGFILLTVAYLFAPNEQVKVEAPKDKESNIT